MALRRAASQLHRSLAPYTTARALAGAPRALGTSFPTMANESTMADNEPFAEPETVGWGATTVGKLLESKPNDSGTWLWCSRDDFVIDAIRKMANANVGSLLVFDPSKISISRESGDIKLKSAAKEAVVGIFTERDYLTKIVVKGRNSSNTKVSAVMTPGESLITVTPSHSVLDVMELMVAKNFRHMPVISEGTMAGMVSVRDVVHVMLKEHREEVGRLQEYIQGTF